jgi:hypothetical protein
MLKPCNEEVVTELLEATATSGKFALRPNAKDLTINSGKQFGEGKKFRSFRRDTLNQLINLFQISFPVHLNCT